MVTEMPQYSALRCVSAIRQNNAKPLISNGLRFIVTCLLTAALGGLFHQARHTFGSIICLSQGIPIETVSKIMGHKHIKTTQRYAKVTQDKIDRDVDRLSEAIGDKFSLYGIDTRPSTIRKDITRRKSNPSWKQAAIIKQMMEG